MTNLDDRLRDALRDRAADVRPNSGALGEIEQGVTRARRRRAAISGMAVVALIVAGGITASTLVSSPGPGGLAGPSDGGEASATPSPGAAPWAQTATYSDPRGFTVKYPADWQRSIFEGNVDLRPPGLPTLSQGEPTFGVSFQIDAGANEPMDCQGEELAQPGTDGTRVVQGRPVPTCEQTGDDKGNWYRRTYTVAWPEMRCDHPSLGCPSEDAGVTVTIRMVGATTELWAQYDSYGEAIAESLRATPPRPTDDVYEGDAGDGNVEPGPATEAQAHKVADAFLQARVRGEGAEAYLTSGARDTVRDLYAYAGHDYIRHDIGELAAADASSWEVSVNLFHSATAGVHEILFVGYDEEGTLKVRGVQRQAVFD